MNELVTLLVFGSGILFGLALPWLTSVVAGEVDALGGRDSLAKERRRLELEALELIANGVDPDDLEELDE